MITQRVVESRGRIAGFEDGFADVDWDYVIPEIVVPFKAGDRVMITIELVEESIKSDNVGVCNWCGGSGKAEKTNYLGEYPQEYDCPVCNGTGKKSIDSDSKRIKP